MTRAARYSQLLQTMPLTGFVSDFNACTTRKSVIPRRARKARYSRDLAKSAINRTGGGG